MMKLHSSKPYKYFSRKFGAVQSPSIPMNHICCIISYNRSASIRTIDVAHCSAAQMRKCSDAAFSKRSWNPAGMPLCTKSRSDIATTTLILHYYYTTTTPLLHHYYTTTTQILHKYYTTTSLLLHYYHTFEFFYSSVSYKFPNII